MGTPLKNPSWIRHAVWAYWEICRRGSTARAELNAKNEKIKQSESDRRFNPSPCIAKLMRGLEWPVRSRGLFLAGNR